MPDPATLSFLIAGHADYFLDLGIEEVMGVGGEDDRGGIGSSSAAAQGDDLFSVGNKPGIQGHDADLHGHLEPLAQHSQGGGDNFRRVSPLELEAKRAVNSGQQVGGGQDLDPCSCNSCLVAASISSTPGSANPT